MGLMVDMEVQECKHGYDINVRNEVRKDILNAGRRQTTKHELFLIDFEIRLT